MALETPSRPPPFMAKSILNFHFDYLTPSLTNFHDKVTKSVTHEGRYRAARAAKKRVHGSYHSAATSKNFDLEIPKLIMLWNNFQLNHPQELAILANHQTT